MIGLDTNVLLRLFESDEDPEQTVAARRLVRERAPVFLSPIVLAEFAWTLRKTFKMDRSGIHARLVGLVEAPEFAVLFPEATRRAVEQYAAGPADFSDYLIGEMNLECGCEYSVTFDQDASRSLAFRPLEQGRRA
jgi:predicted nucleic-acid-binding protein